MTAGNNAALAAPINLICAIRGKDRIALASAIESGGTQDRDARDLLLACLSGRDAGHEIVNVRGRGQRFPRQPFDVSDWEGDPPPSTLGTLVRGLSDGSIDIRDTKKNKGRPIVFWTKPLSDGSLIEDLALEWAAANLQIKGDTIFIKKGAWNAGIDAFIAYSQRYVPITVNDSPSQVDKKESRLENLRREAKSALAAWREFKERANRD